MPDGARERKLRSGSAKQRWAAWRAEVRAAAAEDREQARAEQKRHVEQDYQNPVAFGLGLLVVLVLCVAGWFIVDRMRCDPFYSTIPLSQRHACH